MFNLVLCVLIVTGAAIYGGCVGVVIGRFILWVFYD